MWRRSHVVFWIHKTWEQTAHSAPPSSELHWVPPGSYTHLEQTSFSAFNVKRSKLLGNRSGSRKDYDTSRTVSSETARFSLCGRQRPSPGRPEVRVLMRMQPTKWDRDCGVGRVLVEEEGTLQPSISDDGRLARNQFKVQTTTARHQSRGGGISESQRVTMLTSTVIICLCASLSVRSRLMSKGPSV